MKIESIPGPPEPKWRADRPKERAVVAIDATGFLLVVLEYIGPGLDWLSTFEPLSNAFLRFADELPETPGIWMWEGQLRTHVSYEGERDHYLTGTFRPLTETEAKQSMEGDVPWDPDLWLEREPLTASLPPPAPKTIEANLEGRIHPGEKITLLQLKDIPEDASWEVIFDQILARNYWIQYKLVGTLYKNIMASEVDDLSSRLEKLQRERVSHV